MTRVELKTIEEIKDAVDNGIEVYADTALYKVVKDKNNQYLINSGGHCIGLHGQVGTEYENVLNGVKFWYIK